jgi:hypothetical protein
LDLKAEKLEQAAEDSVMILLNFHDSLNIIRVIRLRKAKWVSHIRDKKYIQYSAQKT